MGEQKTDSDRKAVALDLNIDDITEQYFARIHRAALVLSGNPWDADDLAQETFMVFASQMSRFAGRSSIYTYLYGILLNLDRRERRRLGMKRRKLKIVWDQEPTEGQASPPASAAVEVAEWKRGLWAWVDKLPEGQRHALVLRFSEGMRYDEIAETLDCPLGTVKSRIFHGLSSLRRMLDNEEDSLRTTPAFPDEDLTHAI